jgi:spermidine/putrescine transport system permease protein
MGEISFSEVWWRAFIIVAIVFLLAPIALVMFFSFGDNELATLPITRPTFQWYGNLFANPNFFVALRNSAIVTITVGLTSTAVGTLAALAFARWRVTDAGPVMLVLSLPIMMPSLVLALALATSFSSFSMQLGLHTVIPSHLVFTQPFVILIVYAHLAGFDFAIVDSARDLGASPWHTFRTVIMPLIRPTIIGAALVAMSLSLDDFVITFFTIGNGLTLPTLIWGMLRTGLDPTINALGTLILIATIGSSLIALSLTRYRV